MQVSIGKMGRERYGTVIPFFKDEGEGEEEEEEEEECVQLSFLLKSAVTTGLKPKVIVCLSVCVLLCLVHNLLDSICSA